MAQEFKDYDKLFPQNCFMDYEAEDSLREMSEAIVRWTHGYFQPSQEAVQEAVYDSVTANLWQQFRVSLKGQSTHLKIARLDQRWRQNIALRYHGSDEFKWEVTRMMNYIGALIRGGQLTAASHEIVK